MLIDRGGVPVADREAEGGFIGVLAMVSVSA
jgi:hypothetical protein